MLFSKPTPSVTSFGCAIDIAFRSFCFIDILEMIIQSSISEFDFGLLGFLDKSVFPFCCYFVFDYSHTG